jgi:DNA-binding Lrp family transcriptional regulator
MTAAAVITETTGGTEPTHPLDALDRQIIAATQSGLPLTPRPYHAVAEKIGADPAVVMERFERMLASGAIRRIGVIPNHYALGFRANGMSVWDVEDERASALGRKVGALEFVSHAYLRPRHLPLWRYNLFAMVHGRDRDEVERKTADIAALLGDACRARDTLYSTRILKKTGLRLSAGQSEIERT